MKEIGKEIPQMSESLRSAKELYDSIYGNMPSEKKFVIDQLFGTCSFSSFALEAYNNCLAKDEEDANKIMVVGCFASRSLVHFKIVQDKLNKQVSEMFTILDNTSKWLINKGWHGLPSPVGADGKRCQKDSHTIYEDMIRYSTARDKFMCELRKQKEMYKK